MQTVGIVSISRFLLQLLEPSFYLSLCSRVLKYPDHMFGFTISFKLAEKAIKVNDLGEEETSFLHP